MKNGKKQQFHVIISGENLEWHTKLLEEVGAEDITALVDCRQGVSDIGNFGSPGYIINFKATLEKVRDYERRIAN